MTTGKTIARWTFVGKVMSLLCNMPSRLVIIFLPRSKRLLISWVQSPSGMILKPRKIKSEAMVFPVVMYGCESWTVNKAERQRIDAFELWKRPLISWLQSPKITASGPITSWEIDGETVETVSDFIFGGSKITANGDCSHETKRRLLLGRKIMTNLDSIFKSRDITLPTKVRLVKAMVFPEAMYGCESWTAMKAEHRRIDAFELWCWRRLLRVPWTARRSNQSILKENSPGISLEGMMLKLKLQYFGYLMRRIDSLEKTLMLGGIGRRRGRQQTR